MYFILFFFFSSRRRHTRLQGDWSSDVCSSDLAWLISNPCSPAMRKSRKSTAVASKEPPRYERGDREGRARLLQEIAGIRRFEKRRESPRAQSAGVFPVFLFVLFGFV